MRKLHRLINVTAALVAVLPFLALALQMHAFAATQSSVTFTPDADAYVNASYPDTNYGTGNTLRVDGSPDVRSFLRFSVSGLGGASITQASLELYANSSSSAGVVSEAVADNTWGETTVTYNNMPALGSTLATSPAVSGGTWISLDVTSYVTAEGTYSFGLTTPGATAISLASRESGANAPKLVLALGATSGTSTPTVVSDTPTPGASTPTSTSTALSSTATPTPAPASGSIQHVIVIVMENKSYKQVWSRSTTPYITQLGKKYVRATNYYAITHPSLPNYLDMFAGDNYGITTDCNPSASCHASAVNLADNLEARGLTWKGYMESMPAPCYLTVSGSYAPKHDPFVYFDDIRNDSAQCSSHVVPFTDLSGDLASASTTPNFAFISPDLCNDMHDCSISTGDTWLQNHVPAILNSPACNVDACLLILTWDEDNGSSGNHVLTIFAGSGARTGGATSSAAYNHFSMLRTVENIFGLPTQTGNDAAAGAMTDMLR